MLIIMENLRNQEEPNKDQLRLFEVEERIKPLVHQFVIPNVVEVHFHPRAGVEHDDFIDGLDNVVVVDFRPPEPPDLVA